MLLKLIFFNSTNSDWPLILRQISLVDGTTTLFRHGNLPVRKHIMMSSCRLRLSAHWIRIHTKVSCPNMHEYVRTIPTLLILWTPADCIRVSVVRIRAHGSNVCLPCNWSWDCSYLFVHILTTYFRMNTDPMCA
jgi:hypothetical protein